MQAIALNPDFIERNEYVLINDKIIKTAVQKGEFGLARLLYEAGYEMPRCYISKVLK